jgi:glycosyltransferase involved in cell wall biosynthesis
MFPFAGPIHTLAERPLTERKADALARRAARISPYFTAALKREKPAVVHAHYGPVGAAVALSADAAGIPLCVSFYGIDASAFLSDPRHIARYRRLFASAAVVSALSADMADRLARAGCPEKKIRIHHLAVDTEELTPARAESRSRTKIRIVSAGRFVEKKGMELLIDAFERAVSQGADAELLLFGSGPLEKQAAARAANSRAADSISFFGHKPRAEIIAAVRDADIFALFSITAPDGDMEGTPTVLIEAGALGVPSVSTIHAGIPEVVSNGETGLLVPERDIEAFADALSRLASDPGLRSSMSSAARARVENFFSIRSVMRQIESDYEK